MKDFDFDELDKAVSSVLGAPAPTADTPQNVTPPQVSSDEATADVTMPDPVETPFAQETPEQPETGESETVQTSEPAPAAPASTASRLSVPVAKKRMAGRFMDVVHPSSDMKKAPSLSASRDGVTITPSGATTPEAAEPVEANNDTVVDNTTDTEDQKWPDPIDFSSDTEHAKQNDESSATDAAPKLQDEPQHIEQPSVPELTGTDTTRESDVVVAPETNPLTSPFLPDAKVEKRPLGMATEAENESVPVDLPAAESVAVPPSVDQEPDTGVSTGQPASSPVPEAQAPVPEEAPEPSFTGAQTTAAPSTESARLGSIPQQYKTEPVVAETAETTDASMFDANNYHQPLAHPAKKKSGWGAVIWILILLVLGGAGAYAAFYLGLF